MPSKAATSNETRNGENEIALRVTVAHGSLENASYPIAVGHYYGDAIVGAEAFLDGKLNGRLSRRHAMRLYPGEVGSAEVILAPGEDPPGALVIGLGEIGALSPEILSQGVMLAALRYAIACLESAPPPAEGTYISAAFSSLLIGTSGGHALSVESAVSAVVKGAVLANRVLRDQELWTRVHIDEVQFVELYEDIAARVAHIVCDLHADPLAIGLQNEAIEPCDRLRTLEGAQTRSPGSPYDSDWWRRMQVSELGRERGAKAAGGLEFVMLTDRARAEQTLQAVQRPLIDRLVAEAVTRPDFRPDLHAALYELLLPNTIKDQIKETANLLLVLDSVAANYPWEMLCERGQEPWAIRFGLLRQMRTARFRAQVPASREHFALVIGDPDTGDPSIPPLAGARQEAERVAEVLRDCGYEVVERIGRPALAVTGALYAHEYRIIHITAHGVYDPRHPERSGVVLSRDMRLTAAEIGQLRVVPELVFLNCCYLGRTDEPPEDGKAAPQPTPWNKMTASVAQQLIDIGVRTVVAAGWAVDDQAAKDFGVQFYQRMLAEDEQFGEAVRHARRYLYEHHDYANTWGAFQCYGLPTYTLGGRSHRPARKKPIPVTRNEILEQLRRIRADAQTADPARQQALVDEVRAYDDALRDEWRTGSALYHLGESYAALGELLPAIECYRQALSPQDATAEVPIRALEQLANVEVRRARELRQALSREKREGIPGSARSPEEREAAAACKELLENAHRRLELALAFGDTPERLALLGSCAKSLALESEGEERSQHIRDAAGFYHQGYEQAAARSEGEADPYAALNWITLQFLANDAETNHQQQRTFLDEIANSEQGAARRQEAQPSFWARVHIPDAALLRALIQGDLAEQAEVLLRGYRQVFRARSTAYERESVLNQLSFLGEMLAWKEEQALADEVSRLRQQLLEPVKG